MCVCVYIILCCCFGGGGGGFVVFFCCCLSICVCLCMCVCVCACMCVSVCLCVVMSISMLQLISSQNIDIFGFQEVRLDVDLEPHLTESQVTQLSHYLPDYQVVCWIYSMCISQPWCLYVQYVYQPCSHCVSICTVCVSASHCVSMYSMCISQPWCT